MGSTRTTSTTTSSCTVRLTLAKISITAVCSSFLFSRLKAMSPTIRADTCTFISGRAPSALLTNLKGTSSRKCLSRSPASSTKKICLCSTPLTITWSVRASASRFTISPMISNILVGFWGRVTVDRTVSFCRTSTTTLSTLSSCLKTSIPGPSTSMTTSICSVSVTLTKASTTRICRRSLLGGSINSNSSRTTFMFTWTWCPGFAPGISIVRVKGMSSEAWRTRSPSSTKKICL